MIGTEEVCGFVPYPSMQVRAGWRTIVCTKPPGHDGPCNRKRVITTEPLKGHI